MHTTLLRATAVPYQDCLDTTRPYTRLQTLGDQRRNPYLVYRYDDNGELVRVPHVRYNAQQESSMGVYSCGNPEPDRVTFRRTVQAWREYLEIKPQLDALFRDMSNMSNYYEWEAMRTNAQEQLRSAYYFDTSDVNSRNNVNQMGLDTLCRIAERIHAQYADAAPITVSH